MYVLYILSRASSSGRRSTSLTVGTALAGMTGLRRLSSKSYNLSWVCLQPKGSQTGSGSHGVPLKLHMIREPERQASPCGICLSRSSVEVEMVSGAAGGCGDRTALQPPSVLRSGDAAVRIDRPHRIARRTELVSIRAQPDPMGRSTWFIEVQVSMRWTPRRERRYALWTGAARQLAGGTCSNWARAKRCHVI